MKESHCIYPLRGCNFNCRPVRSVVLRRESSARRSRKFRPLITLQQFGCLTDTNSGTDAHCNLKSSLKVGKKTRNACKILLRDHFRCLDVDERIKINGWQRNRLWWYELVWNASGQGLLLIRWWTFGFRKGREFLNQLKIYQQLKESVIHETVLWQIAKQWQSLRISGLYWWHNWTSICNRNGLYNCRKNSDECSLKTWA